MIFWKSWHDYLCNRDYIQIVPTIFIYAKTVRKQLLDKTAKIAKSQNCRSCQINQNCQNTQKHMKLLKPKLSKWPNRPKTELWKRPKFFKRKRLSKWPKLAKQLKTVKTSKTAKTIKMAKTVKMAKTIEMAKRWKRPTLLKTGMIIKMYIQKIWNYENCYKSSKNGQS